MPPPDQSGSPRPGPRVPASGPLAGAGEPSEPVVLAETRDLVGIARINRPEARNALSPEVMEMLAQLVEAWDADPRVHAIVVAGDDDFFAAGADVGDLRERSFQDTLVGPGARFWSRIATCRTPLVAAVSGYALGGGCELALICDLIVASRTAELGQPEVMLGIIPGGGGTQRLARAVGKHRAMELVLTGRRIKAEEAYELGLVNRVTEPGDWLEEAIDVAGVIARRPPIAVRLAKQAVLAADETGLSAGLDHERRLFELAMATEDRIEGMDAFLEKRRPEFRGR
jgi:enoyl-CoA hydratase/carnithine racemase